jgi:uncharacterized repeat protein (TIGR03803 family)
MPRSLSIPHAAIAICLNIIILGSHAISQTVSTVYNFRGTQGGNPLTVALTQGRDGRLYGTTLYGGAHGQGTVFSITPSGQYSLLHSFSGSDGANPWGGVTLGTDGNFYGATQSGGSSNQGVVFKMSYSGAVTVVHSFTGGNDGRAPLSSPVEGDDGNFYGTTEYGGPLFGGVVYQVTRSGGYKIIYDYDPSVGETLQFAPLVGNDSNLYVVALQGGANGCGSVLQLSTAGVAGEQYSFDCSSNGSNPDASLVQAADGNFYGVTYNGGAKGGGYGILFRLSQSFAETTLYSFKFGSNALQNPDTALLQATDGNLYGVAYAGGTKGDGGIYQFSSAGTYSTLYDWTEQTNPQGTLTQHTNGKMYGVSYNGGTYNVGTLYSLDMGLGPFVTFVRNSGNVASTVQVFGQGLTGASSVTFNGLPAHSYTVVSDTYLTAVVPGGATTGPVVVTTPSGTLNSNKNFRVTQ